MLKIENLTKVFNLTGNPLDDRIALDNINLTIEDGEFVTIIGGNGSGKSTLMNSIAGSIKSDNGNIIINDIDITKLDEYKRAKYIGRVFQDPMKGTASNMSILENLMLAYRRDKSKTLKWGFDKEHTDKFREIIKEIGLGLENRLEEKVGLLSGGQRQALTLIMATLSKPEILLLDEHTAALDPKTQKNIMELTNKIVCDNKITTLMITHNMKDAIEYGDRLIMFKDGNIIHDFKGDEKKKLKVIDLMKMFETIENSI